MYTSNIGGSSFSSFGASNGGSGFSSFGANGMGQTRTNFPISNIGGSNFGANSLSQTRTNFPIRNNPTDRISNQPPRISVRQESTLNKPGESRPMCTIRVTAQKVGNNAGLGMVGGGAAGGIHGATAGGAAGVATGLVQGGYAAYNGCKTNPPSIGKKK